MSMLLPQTPIEKSRLNLWLVAVLLIVPVLGLGVTMKNTLSENVLDHEWLDGTVTERFEKEVHGTSPLLSSLGDIYRNLRFWAFGEASRGALIGEEGWLFTTEEFISDPVSAEIHLQDNLQEIITTIHHLRENGVSVLVALLPDKSRVLHSMLGDYSQSPHAQQRYHRVRQTLMLSGIFVPDLRPRLLQHDAREIFFKTDTHWTPKGSRIVAETLNEEIRWLTPELTDRTAFAESGFSRELHQGDLKKFAPSLALDAPHEAYFSPTIASLPQEDLSAQTLFGDIAHDIALIGTSFSANPRWSFADHLRLETQSHILNLAKEGQGVLEPMRELQQSGFFANTPPKLLIWEIPERYLSRLKGK